MSAQPVAIPEVKEYFIVTTTKADGGYLMFWRPKEAGYTAFLERAGRYSEQQARSISKPRDSHEPQIDFMVPCEAVEAKALRVVDFDHLCDLTAVTA